MYVSCRIEFFSESGITVDSVRIVITTFELIIINDYSKEKLSFNCLNKNWTLIVNKMLSVIKGRGNRFFSHRNAFVICIWLKNWIIYFSTFFRCHRPRDSLFSWSSGFDNFTGLVNWGFLLLTMGGFRLLLENLIK